MKRRIIALLLSILLGILAAAAGDLLFTLKSPSDIDSTILTYGGIIILMLVASISFWGIYLCKKIQDIQKDINILKQENRKQALKNIKNE